MSLIRDMAIWACVQVEIAMIEKNRVMYEDALKIVRAHRFRRDEKKMGSYNSMVNSYIIMGT